MVLTIGVGAGAGLVLGWPWTDAVWFGACVSLSSTMVILKTLQGQGRLGTLSSRVMIGMLLVQDLAVVPLLILLPKLTDLQAGLPDLGWALVRSAVFLVLMIVVGTRAIPWLMRQVSRWNSRELFLLSVTGLGLGIGFATYKVGLSFAFGAFVAGMVLSESDHAHQALSDIVPLRDIFGLLFFVSVGMLLDPAYLRANLPMVLALVVVVALAKGLICAGRGPGLRLRQRGAAGAGPDHVPGRRVRLRDRAGRRGHRQHRARPLRHGDGGGPGHHVPDPVRVPGHGAGLRGGQAPAPGRAAADHQHRQREPARPRDPGRGRAHRPRRGPGAGAAGAALRDHRTGPAPAGGLPGRRAWP